MVTVRQRYQNVHNAQVTKTDFKIQRIQFQGWNTVDGWNPAPVDMVNIPLFTGFHTSQVVQDFFHQQYQYLRTIRHLKQLPTCHVCEFFPLNFPYSIWSFSQQLGPWSLWRLERKTFPVLSFPFWGVSGHQTSVFSTHAPRVPPSQRKTQRKSESLRGTFFFEGSEGFQFDLSGNLSWPSWSNKSGFSRWRTFCQNFNEFGWNFTKPKLQILQCWKNFWEKTANKLTVH